MGNIIFRVDGDHGEKIGLGHVKRSLLIYKELKKKLKKKIFYFLMKNNKIGKNIIKNQTKEKIINYKSNNLDYSFKQFDPNKDTLIIDTFGNTTELNKYLNKINFKKVISFDNLVDNLKHPNLIFNGIIFAKKKIEKKNFSKIFQGLRYLVLSQKMKKKKYKKLNKKKFYKILICSGGADIRNMLYAVTKRLFKLNFLILNIILGPGVKNTNPIFSLKNKNINFIHQPKDLSSHIQNNDICITAGGTVMFECLLNSKPLIVIPTYEHQKYAINFFKKKNAIIHLKNKNHLINFFSNLEKQLNLLNKISKKSSSLISDKGLSLVTKKIFHFINEKN